MNDLGTLLLLALIFTLIGFSLGSLINGLRGAGERKETPPDASQVAVIWRDKATGHLLVEIGSRLAASSGELDPGRQARLAQLVADLRLWLNLPPPEAVAASPAEATGPDDAALPLPAPAPAVPPLTAATGAALLKRSSLNPVEVLVRAIQTEVGKVDSNRSIAAQVDEILQEKLLGSPLRERSIRLMELPGKGLVVLVGLDQYPGVEDVPDPEIKALLRSCVAEWERRVSGD